MEYRLLLSISALLAGLLLALVYILFRERRKKIKNERTIIAYSDRLERQKEALHELMTYNGLYNGSLHTAVMRIAEITCEALDADSTSFWHYDAEKKNLVCYEKYVPYRHLCLLPVDLNRHKDIYEYLSHPGTHTISSDTNGALFKKFRSICERETTSLLVSSIFFEGHFRGIFCIERSKEDPWEEDERTFCTSISDHLATALLLYERTSLKRDLVLTSSAISSAQEGIAILDYEGRLIFANMAYCQLHGYNSQEEITGKPWYLFYEAEERSRFRNHLLPLLRAKRKLTVETSGQKRSGRIFPQELSLSLIDGDRFVVVVRDITDRKRVEKNAHQFALFTTLNPSPVIRFNLSGSVVLANPAAVDIFGISRRQDIQEIIPSLSRRQITQCIKNGETQTFTDTIRGRMFFITLRGLTDLNMAHLYANDITALDIAERKLVESEQFLRLVIDSAPSAIFVKDRTGKYTLANQTTANLFGTTVQEVIGKTDRELLQDEGQVQGFQDDDLEVLTLGREKLIRREDLTDNKGKKHVFQTVKRPLYLTQSAEPSHILGVATDITQTHALQDKLNQTLKMEAIGQMAGGIAHDFNNLLTGILGYTEVLKAESKDSPEQLEAARSIESISIQAAELTQKLLSFARKGKHQNIPTNLHETLDETISLLHRTFDERIQIGKEFRAKRSVICCDPTQIQQLILNLALNARDAVLPAVRQSCAGMLLFSTDTYIHHTSEDLSSSDLQLKEGEYIRLSVEDNGHGIPPEILDKIFNPFFTTKEVGKGTGMGLAMVYGIVESHGGTTTVSSQINQGTRFDIYLPLTKQQEARPRRSPLIPETSIVSGQGSILFVDDHHVIRNVTAQMLKSLGYEVMTAKDGYEALHYYEKNKSQIDLVILDMIMPRMGARECFQKIREMNPQVRAILSTGYANNHAVEEVLNQGMIGFVQKPFQLGVLARAIAEALQH